MKMGRVSKRGISNAAVILVPQLETFCKTKEQRLAEKNGIKLGFMQGFRQILTNVRVNP